MRTLHLLCLAILLLAGCGKVRFIPGPPPPKYTITATNGWSRMGGQCDSYKIDGNRVILYDADGRVAGEALCGEGWGIAIDRN